MRRGPAGLCQGRWFAGRHAILGAALGWLLACGPLATPEAPGARVEPALTVDEVGGELWGFSRQVSGRAGDACDAVTLTRGPVHVEAELRDRTYAAVVPLHSGENRVVVRCLAGGVSRRELQVTYRVRLEDRPTARIRMQVSEEGVMLDAGGSEVSEASLAPVVGHRWEAGEGPEPLRSAVGTLLDGHTASTVLVRRPRTDGVYRVGLRVIDARGRRDVARAYFEVRDGEARAPDLTRDPPPWANDAMVYGVVPALFGEPAFVAVTERLPQVAALGVNTIWLTPVQRAPPGDFGYEVLDHFAVNEALGTAEELEMLIERAHGLGMRVLVDFVPNHTSRGHAYFEHAERFGRASPHYGYYQRDAMGQLVHYFDWEHLPNLDFDHPEVRRMVVEAAAHWVRRFDVDGFRVDVAWGVDQRAPELFATLRDEVKRMAPEALLIAEASAREPRYFTHGFDAAYDWTEQVGQWAWADVFGEAGVDLARLQRALTADGEGFPEEAIVFRFLENNDTGERFHDRYGDGAHRVASALLFTLPGIPSLFTGQETGASYHPYERERPLPFEPHPDREAHLSRLAELRAAEPGLRRGGFVPLEVEPADRVYAYLRLPDPRGRPLLVVLGFADRPVTARLTLDSRILEGLGEGPWVDLLDAGRAPRRRLDHLEVQVAAHGARVLAPQESARVLAPQESARAHR